jgi:hypothetical protein
MSKLVGCDYTCQRKKNIVKLRDLYEKELNNYYNAYSTYLQYKYDNSSDRAWKKNYAETTLRPKVVGINKNLNKILRQLKRNINYTNKLINRHKRMVNTKSTSVIQKNKTIKYQDNYIDDKNIDLLSKNRQVEFSKERNSYKRIMLIVLVIINIILIALFYYLVMKK